ncbi:MAG: AAA family ATPase [Nitrococcus sp.]|nr:AAA family ATPase [Nitrococcus sp.]
MARQGLEIRLFGSLDVLRGGCRLQLPRSRKARALLAYLVVAERAHRREQLCDLLWDGPADPRAELRWTLAKIRPLLNEPGITRVVADQECVAFERANADIDLLAVRALLPAEPFEVGTQALQQAAARLRGPFLEGLDLPECYRFDAWCVAEREALRRLHDAVLRTLIGRLRDDPKAALRHARDRILMDPLSEDAHTGLVTLLAEMGCVNEALNRYERCRRMLALEFGRQPSAVLDQVRRAITKTRAGPAVRQASEPPRPRSTPIIGRHEECQRLDRLIADIVAGHSSDALLVRGEPGIGKTRLLEELKARVRAAGAELLAGRAFEVERGRPYAVWVDALRSFGTDRIPANIRPELAPLLPELGPAPGELTERNRLFDGVVSLLDALAAETGLAAVVLDDIQWLDDASAALTHYVARATAGRRVLLALAARDGELEDSPASLRLIQTLQRDGRLGTLKVNPLDPEEAARLARSIAPALDTARIFREGEGNPLFVQEIARSLDQTGDVLSGTLAGLVGERLTGLDRETAAMIPWMAALGRRFNLEVLTAVASLPSRKLLAVLEDLERRALVRVSAAGGYEFAHDVIRQVAYRRISEPRRRMVHLQIARTLVRPMEQNHARASEVAHHADLGSDHELAARACALAGQHGLRIFAFADVAALIERGQAHLEQLPLDKRIPLHLDLLGLYAHSGMHRHRPSGLDATLWGLLDEAQTQGMSAQVQSAFNMIAMLCYLRGDMGDALSALQRSEKIGRSAEPEAMLNAIAQTARCLGLLDRRMDRAEQLAREAAALAERLGTAESDCALPIALALVDLHKGELERSRAYFERALILARRDRYPWWEYYCLSRLPMIELERGEPAAALARCEELSRVAKQLGPGAEAPFASALEALVRLAMGESQATAAVDRAAAQLQEADSQGLIAYVQNVAAEIDYRAGRAGRARERSQEALQAATIVDQRSEAAIARAMLACLAEGAVAARFVDAMREELASPGRLSARAARAVRAAMDALSA